MDPLLSLVWRYIVSKAHNLLLLDPQFKSWKVYLWLCLNSHYSLCRCMTQRCPSYAIACSEACWTILKPGFSCSPTMGNHQISNRNWKDIQHCSPVLNNLHQSKIGLENFDLLLMIMKNWQTRLQKTKRSQALTPRDFNLLKLETDQDQPFLDMNSAQEPAVLSIPNNQTTLVQTYLKAYPKRCVKIAAKRIIMVVPWWLQHK